MGKRPQPPLRTDAPTGEWRNGEAGEGRGSEPCEPCVLFGRVPAPSVRWAMYTLGAALLPAGLVLALPAGRLRWAAACGSGLGGWGRSCPFSSAVPVLIFWVVRHCRSRARGCPVCGLRCRCLAC